MSINEIIAIMDRLNMMHRSLLNVAYQKTEILKTSNVDDLSELMKNEQSHVAAISQLEGQRQQAIIGFFEQRSITPQEATVTELVKYANAEESEQLMNKRNELLLTIETLQQQNELNQKMLFQSLQFVNLTLDLLRPQPDQINYGAKEGASNTEKRGQFDSQA